MTIPPASTRRPPGSGPFVALCVTVIVGAFVWVLLVNTTMAGGAYEAKSLRAELADLTDRGADLLVMLDANAAPQHLAQAARDLGMAPATTMGFINLGRGTVAITGGHG